MFYYRDKGSEKTWVIPVMHFNFLRKNMLSYARLSEICSGQAQVLKPEIIMEIKS